MRRLLGLAAVGTFVAILLSAGAVPAAADRSPVTATGLRPSVPVLAYYYIWFDAKSWDRAKRDYPLAGRYSSNDAAVMRQHIEAAKQAGITGFIVSWKHTPSLDRRLATLVDIAESEHFSLSMIYQGLDFYRRPVPTEQVGRDLEFFARTFAPRAPFHMFAKPMVIWSGTWKFSTADIARITEPVRDRLLVLASEKNVAGYERLVGAVDGDAYYWSSVNPQTFPGYEEKLAAMAQSIHTHGGRWIAPAAAGFDARDIGGKTTVARNGGATLIRECGAALHSSPDAIGLISWNEFSENSHIEPSLHHGTKYLEVAARCSHTARAGRPAAVAGAVDSVDSSSSGKGMATGVIVAPLALIGFTIALATVLRRSRTHRSGTADVVSSFAGVGEGRIHGPIRRPAPTPSPEHRT